MAKNKLNGDHGGGHTMHSFRHIVFRKAYISYIMINCTVAALSDCAPADNNDTMIISL